jgi:hypothetical protein
MDVSKEEKKYIDSFSSKEKKAYEIAKNHLGSTFNLVKSNGFIKWKNTSHSSSSSS